MRFFPRFIFNDGSEAGNGGGAGSPEEKSGENGGGAGNATPDVSLLTVDEIKGFGFDSKEALLSHLQQHKTNSIPEAEKTKAAGIEKAELMKFAVENDILKPEDFSTYESLAAKADRDLVFERYSAEQKEDNPDISDEDLKTGFETLYRLNSENEAAKKRGETKIAKEAKDLRTPLETNLNTAKERFADDKKMRTAYPVYTQFMDDVLKENLPDKVTLKIKDGETEIPVEVEITDELRKKAVEKFKNEKTFYSYFKADGKTDDLKKSLTAKIQSFIRNESFDGITAKIAQTFKKLGTKDGSNIGAEQPFAVVKGGKNPAADKPLTAREGVMKNQMELRDKVGGYS